MPSDSDWTTVKEEKVSDCLYLCPECNQLFAQSRSLLAHLKKAHQKDVADVEQYGISMENSILRLNRVYKENRPLNFKCLKCNGSFTYRMLGKHVRVDVKTRRVGCVQSYPHGVKLGISQQDRFLEGESRRTFLCQYCGEYFVERNTYMNHIATHGEEGRKYKCEYCDYAATAPKVLRYHINNKHSGPRERNHVCDICAKAFYEKISLVEHVKFVHEKTRKFQCPHCPKVYDRPQSFRRHVKKHSGVKPHQCPHCEKSFFVNDNLKTHLRYHTGEKPFMCTLCNAAFPQRNSLNIHLKSHERRDGITLGPGEGVAVKTGQFTQPTLSTSIPPSTRADATLDFNAERHLISQHATHLSFSTEALMSDKLTIDPSTGHPVPQPQLMGLSGPDRDASVLSATQSLLSIPSRDLGISGTSRDASALLRGPDLSSAGMLGVPRAMQAENTGYGLDVSHGSIELDPSLMADQLRPGHEGMMDQYMMDSQRRH